MNITKKDLNDYRKLKLEIPVIQDQIKELEIWVANAAPGATQLTGMPVSHGDPDKTGQILVRLDNLKWLYKKYIDRALEKLTDIELAIMVLDEREQMLIRFRYMKAMNWEDVADSMGYSIRQTTRIHGLIIQKLANQTSMVPVPAIKTCP